MKDTTVLCLIFCPIIQFSFQTALFDVFPKSFKCDFNKSLVANFSCKLITARNKPAILHGVGTLKVPINTLMVNFTLFFKYGTIYRPYLLDFKDADFCLAFSGKVPHWYKRVLPLFLKYVTDNFPQLMKGCPLSGEYVVHVDVNKTLSSVLPPILPAGIYKPVARFYLKTFETLMTLEGTGEIKPNFANRAVDFKMG